MAETAPQPAQLKAAEPAALVPVPMAAAPAAAAAAAPAQAVPRIASPPAGLTGVSVGNNQNTHGLALLPSTWQGWPNFFDGLTDADADLLRLLDPFGDTGAVLGRFLAFEWRVGDSPLFHHTSVGLQWECVTLAPERVAVLGQRRRRGG